MTGPLMNSPFGPLVVIANSKAARGKIEAVERVLAGHGLRYRVVRTAYPGHATDAARDALRAGERYLVAAGGDGTVHEVVNGMLEHTEHTEHTGHTGHTGHAVLGVVAAGSGCDFVRSFGLPGDARHLTGDRVRVIDLGKVTFTSGTSEVTRYFPNIAQAGLGAAVVARAGTLPGFLGGAKYPCGFWLTLPRFRPPVVRIEADGHAYTWRAHNVVVANCRFYGGGMQISPKSLPDDGAFDVLVMAGPKSDAFTTLPKVYRGRHLPHRNIAELRAGRVRIEADPPVPVEADGELLGTTPATFEIIPGALRLKV